MNYRIDCDIDLDEVRATRRKEHAEQHAGYKAALDAFCGVG